MAWKDKEKRKEYERSEGRVAYRKEYYKKNRDRLLSVGKAWRDKNKPKKKWKPGAVNAADMRRLAKWLFKADILLEQKRRKNERNKKYKQGYNRKNRSIVNQKVREAERLRSPKLWKIFEIDITIPTKSKKINKNMKRKIYTQKALLKLKQDPEKYKIYRKKKNKYERRRYHKDPELRRRDILQAIEWTNNNKERVKELTKRYRPKINAYRNQRMKTDINYRIKCRLRISLYKALVEYKGKKEMKMEEYLGCRVNELKRYLEKQFKPWMNWENYGSLWHIDHRKACANFDLTKIEQQKECFHWSNLQPLEAKLNMSKGAKYDEPSLLQFSEFETHKTVTLNALQKRSNSTQT